MRNEKERRQFVTDPENWEVIEKYSGSHPGGLRVLELTYGGEAWYRIQAEQTGLWYNRETGRVEERVDWVTIAQFAPAGGDDFGTRISDSQIVDIIKEIDLGRR